MTAPACLLGWACGSAGASASMLNSCCALSTLLGSSAMRLPAAVAKAGAAGASAGPSSLPSEGGGGGGVGAATSSSMLNSARACSRRAGSRCTALPAAVANPIGAPGLLGGAAALAAMAAASALQLPCSRAQPEGAACRLCAGDLDLAWDVIVCQQLHAPHAQAPVKDNVQDTITMHDLRKS